VIEGRVYYKMIKYKNYKIYKFIYKSYDKLVEYKGFSLV